MNAITLTTATAVAVLSAPACAQWHPNAINRILEAPLPDEGLAGAVSVDGFDDTWLIGGALWTPSSPEPVDLESETEVVRRAREARERTNRRWLERRVRDRHPIEPGSDGLSSDWFDSDERPDPVKWPWWLW